MTPQTSRTRAGSKRRPFSATAPANRKVTLYIRDPVFILGQGFGVFVYLRNLYFELRDRRAAA